MIFIGNCDQGVMAFSPVYGQAEPLFTGVTTNLGLFLITRTHITHSFSRDVLRLYDISIAIYRSCHYTLPQSALIRTAIYTTKILVTCSSIGASITVV